MKISYLFLGIILLFTHDLQSMISSTNIQKLVKPPIKTPLTDLLWLLQINHREMFHKRLSGSIQSCVQTSNRWMAMGPSFSQFLIDLCVRKPIVILQPLVKTTQKNGWFGDSLRLAFTTKLVCMHYRPNLNITESFKELAQTIDPNLVIGTIELELLKNMIPILVQHKNYETLQYFMSKEWFRNNTELGPMAINEKQEYCLLLQKAINNNTSILDFYTFYLNLEYTYHTLYKKQNKQDFISYFRLFLAELPQNQLDTASKQQLIELRKLLLKVINAWVNKTNWNSIYTHLKPMHESDEYITENMDRAFINASQKFLCTHPENPSLDLWNKFYQQIKPLAIKQVLPLNSDQYNSLRY